MSAITLDGAEPPASVVENCRILQGNGQFTKKTLLNPSYWTRSPFASYITKHIN